MANCVNSSLSTAPMSSTRAEREKRGHHDSQGVRVRAESAGRSLNSGQRVEEAAHKGRIRAFWDSTPCGLADVPNTSDDAALFEALDRRRYGLEPFIEDYAQFNRYCGRRVLEIGCGLGADLLRFGRGGAHATGIDMSLRSARFAARRFDLAELPARVVVADAETLPFADERFDLVYSWGVLHHTPDIGRAVAEIYRVLVVGGEACIMLYNRRSVVAAQAWVRYALLGARPWRTLDSVLATHVESPGTQAFTARSATNLFQRAGFGTVTTEVIVTPWDGRVGRRIFLPIWCRSLIPRRFGWFLVVRAVKQTAAVSCSA